MRVLLTGGAGYVGSHTALVLLEAGLEVIVLDDFSNSNIRAIRCIEDLVGRSIQVVAADLADRASLAKLDDIDFDAAIHFAGLKAVGESVVDPDRYYRVNLNATLNLLEAMRSHDATKLVFSSSATVYGEPQYLPQDEAHPVGTRLASPYARSKLMSEHIIQDAQAAWPDLSAVVLRYFNPVGAHPSGYIGENPSGTPGNLMPYIAQVAIGRRDFLRVYGDDYPTLDGTGIRDYIHIMDLAEGHLAALRLNCGGVATYNLGTGIGASVLQVLRSFERASHRRIPWQVYPRRPGDVPEMVANPAQAKADLRWDPSRSLMDACRDTWAWQSTPPDGF